MKLKRPIIWIAFSTAIFVVCSIVMLSGRSIFGQSETAIYVFMAIWAGSVIVGSVALSQMISPILGRLIGTYRK